VDEGERLDKTTGGLWLAGAGWGLLTILLMALLGFGLPVLIAGTLAPVLPRASVVVGAAVGATLSAATAALLLRDTRRRYTARPRLLRALTIGYTVAMVISVPLLLGWFAASILVALGA
jgi:hypothetical protein